MRFIVVIFLILTGSVFFAVNNLYHHMDSTKLDTIEEGSFSIVVLPDFQSYARETPRLWESNARRSWKNLSSDPLNPELWRRVIRPYSIKDVNGMIGWIIDNKKPQNIRHVVQVGDLVSEGESEAEWRLLSKEMNRLFGVVPFSISPGNHDLTQDCKGSRNFSDFYPKLYFEQKQTFRGSYDGMLSSYFEISDSLLLLNLIVNAPDDHLVWADEVLRTHQQHRVIVVTHNWLGPISDETGDKGGTDRKNGEAIIGIMQKKHAQRNSLIPHCKCGINLYQITRIY